MVEFAVETQDAPRVGLRSERDPRRIGAQLNRVPSQASEKKLPDSSHEGDEGVGEAVPVDQSGRPLGARALQTRQRILDATVELLGEKTLRDLRVIDIARKVGSSPATFYQYFKDVEDVVLHLANLGLQRTPSAVQMIRGGWSGEAGFERARRLVNRAMDHWDDLGPILRARNNAADEGDQRFRDVRFKAIMPMVNAFTEEIKASHERAKSSGEASSPEVQDVPGSIDPTVGGMTLFAIMDRISMYRPTIEEQGIRREEIVDTIATVFQFVITSRK